MKGVLMIGIVLAVALAVMGCESVEDGGDGDGGDGVVMAIVLFPQVTEDAESPLDALLAQVDHYALCVTKTGEDDPAYDNSDIPPDVGSIDVPSLTADEYTFELQVIGADSAFMGAGTATASLSVGNNYVTISLNQSGDGDGDGEGTVIVGYEWPDDEEEDEE